MRRHQSGPDMFGTLIYEGDDKDPQATFWTRITHVESGETYYDRVGFIRRNDLLRKLVEKMVRGTAQKMEAGKCSR